MGTMPVEFNDWNMDTTEIKRMSDLELYNTLTNRGVQIGPVVASTRNLYEKKLYQILNSSQSEPVGANSFGHFSSPNNNQDSPMRTEMAGMGSRAIPSVPQPSENIIESPVVQASPEPVLEFHTPSTPTQSSTFDDTKDDNQYSYRTPVYDYSHVRPRPALYSGDSRIRSRELKKEKSQYFDDQNSVKTKKLESTSKVSTVIEILVLTFLIVVGYVFYKEMAYYSEAVESKITDSL
ncbi:hypothetical protein CHUAL_013402 [Chamberlinius hualienensis]